MDLEREKEEREEGLEVESRSGEEAAAAPSSYSSDSWWLQLGQVGNGVYSLCC